jgi:hypothetical protein
MVIQCILLGNAPSMVAKGTDTTRASSSSRAQCRADRKFRSPNTCSSSSNRHGARIPAVPPPSNRLPRGSIPREDRHHHRATTTSSGHLRSASIRVAVRRPP